VRIDVLTGFFPPRITQAELALGVAAAALIAGYVGFILGPAWSSYGRVWERIAASLLTLFMLATLLGIGAAIGLAVVFYYDQLV
jgi:hypothetical protein